MFRGRGDDESGRGREGDGCLEVGEMMKVVGVGKVMEVLEVREMMKVVGVVKVMYVLEVGWGDGESGRGREDDESGRGRGDDESGRGREGDGCLEVGEMVKVVGVGKVMDVIEVGDMMKVVGVAKVMDVLEVGKGGDEHGRGGGHGQYMYT